jgi:hypothetical protein
MLSGIEEIKKNGISAVVIFRSVNVSFSKTSFIGFREKVVIALNLK